MMDALGAEESSSGWDDNPRATQKPAMFNVVVVGAGVAGLYAVYLLRERGLSVRGLEAGAGVGGTWYWNRYPGARCDVPSVEYSYGFSPELEQNWEWSEFFPGQEELERYLNHVADRFDIRREIQFSTCVTAATFDEGSDRWVVETDYGDRYSARFVVMTTGALSVPTRPEIEGIESSGGLVLQTSMWPTEVDLAGTRIAFVGTGSSGVQAAPNLAKVADHLYVLQRGPSPGPPTMARWTQSSSSGSRTAIGSSGLSNG